MLQNDEITFQQVAQKKRLDRLGQILFLAGGCYGMFSAAKLALVSISKALGQKTSTIAAGIAGFSLAATLLKKILPFFVKGLAPADALNKANTKVT